MKKRKLRTSQACCKYRSYAHCLCCSLPRGCNPAWALRISPRGKFPLCHCGQKGFFRSHREAFGLEKVENTFFENKMIQIPTWRTLLTELSINYCPIHKNLSQGPKKVDAFKHSLCRMRITPLINNLAYIQTLTFSVGQKIMLSSCCMT